MSAAAQVSSEVSVLPASKESLLECERLICEVFGWSDSDVLPAWVMHTSGLHGGLNLGAYVRGELVGCSCALAAYDGREPFLYSIGLAVRRGFEGRGIAKLLKLAQRHHALERGYRAIRWTVDPLASRPVYLYLTGLGAELVGYAAEMYDVFGLGGLDAGIVADEAEVLWTLESEPPVRSGPGAGWTRSANLVTVTSRDPGTAACVREFRGLSDFDADSTCFVELPWDVQALKAASLQLATDWRYGVRTAMQTLLDLGLRGTHVALDHEEHRSFLGFQTVPRKDPS